MSSVYTCFEWREHVLEEESVERRKGEEGEEGGKGGRGAFQFGDCGRLGKC